MTACAVVSVTVKVATPFEPVVPVTVVMMDAPAPWFSVTVWPEAGLPEASSRVTVMVELLVPFAVTLVGDATMVDLPGLVVDVTGPVVNVTETEPTAKFDCVVSTAL